MNRTLLIFLLVALVALSWWRLQPTDEGVRRSRLLMGTVVEIVAHGAPAEQAVDEAFGEIDLVQQPDLEPTFVSGDVGRELVAHVGHE